MAELEGGEERPRIYDRESLKRWLDALPPDRRETGGHRQSRRAQRSASCR